MSPFRSIRSLDTVAKLYLVSQFIRALYFAWPIWYGFASLSLNPVQVGAYFSIAYGVQLVSEVPTGAFADRYGRKISALIGSVLLTILPLVLYFGHNFPAYVVGGVISGIGYAFISGSLEALVYDHINISKEVFRTIAWLEVSAFQAGLIVSTASGGFLYTVHHSLPFIAEAIAGIIGVGLIAAMSETHQKVKNKERYVGYFKTGLRHLLATKYLRTVVLLGVPVAVLFALGIDFVNEKRMIELGIEPSMRGLLLAGVKILSLIVLNVMLYKLLQTDRSRILFIAIVGAIIFVLLSFESLPMFLAGFIMFNWLSASHGSFIRPILHDLLPSSHRATAMSGYSAIIGIVSLGGSMLAGYLIQTFNTARTVYLLGAIVFVLLIIPCAWWLSRYLKPKTHRYQTPEIA